MGSIKDRNGMDRTEAEDIKKRWQEYIGELYKKDLHDPDNHDDSITHLKPDILECEVKWALGSITTNKASGGDGFPVDLLQILKDDAVKVLHSICQQVWSWDTNILHAVRQLSLCTATTEATGSRARMPQLDSVQAPQEKISHDSQKILHATIKTQQSLVN